jgi:hypothetical protein
MPHNVRYSVSVKNPRFAECRPCIANVLANKNHGSCYWLLSEPGENAMP